MERFLYRVSQSKHSSSFVLKGALLLHVWQGETARSTSDIDLLGFGSNSPEAVADRIRGCLLAEVPPDGILFDPEALRVEPIAEEAEYHGVRVHVPGLLGKMRLALQVDVGFGDALVPEPSLVDYPLMLDHPAPRLLAYARECLVAEKFEAMVKLGAANSRMKDFNDLYGLSRTMPFDGALLVKALDATLGKRGTVVLEALPLVLTPEFALLPEKVIQWRSYLKKKSFVVSPPESFAEVLASIRRFIIPPFTAIRQRTAFQEQWHPGGPWGSG
jgi:hypothetical protein